MTASCQIALLIRSVGVCEGGGGCLSTPGFSCGMGEQGPSCLSARPNGSTARVLGPPHSARKTREAPQGPCDADAPPSHTLTDRVKNLLAITCPRQEPLGKKTELAQESLCMTQPLSRTRDQPFLNAGPKRHNRNRQSVAGTASVAYANP